jgi:DNA-binding GntR family transcriptional regulator
MTAKAIDLNARRPKGTGRQYAYDVLREGILTLEFPPGEALDEAMLVDQIGVSRTLIREAMISLSSEGLIDLLPNRGARVTSLEITDVRAFHEGMELVQRAVTRWAAVRNRQEHYGAIHRERIAFERAVKARDGDAMIDSNRRFHMAIGDACGNPFVAESYARLLTVGLRLSRLLVTYDVNQDGSLAVHLDRIVEQHREMERLIVAHDADAAESLGAAHARLSLDRSLATLGNTLAGSITLPIVR